jgi:hypothetical protein
MGQYARRAQGRRRRAWASYPKRSAKVATDLTRDHGWEAFATADWRPVTQVSIDDVWSALRFRPLAEVGR